MELKVTVPTDLSEITVDQYQRFARLEGDEEFLTHKMLEIFCGVPLSNTSVLHGWRVTRSSLPIRCLRYFAMCL